MDTRDNGMAVAAVAIAAVICMYPMPAAAYLDPGTGSLIIQGIVGALAAAAVTLKLYWHKFKALFRPRQKDQQPVTSTDETAGTKRNP